MFGGLDPLVAAIPLDLAFVGVEGEVPHQAISMRAFGERLADILVAP